MPDIEMPNTDLATVSQGVTVAAPASDYRSDMMRLPVEQMAIAQAEYVARRKQFREWLLSQLQVGVHFGFVPGTEPKFVDENGRDCDHTKAKGVKVWSSKKNGWDVVSFSSWTAKPSLYKAGAQFVVDLLNLIPVYSADEVGWRQLGSPTGVFVYSCRLFPKGAAFIDENMKGEGRGVRKVGQKGGDENNAIKMAQKSALVDAVLNGFGLGDLFTQDTEDAQVPHEAPAQKEDAPKTQPRNTRVAPKSFDDLKRLWAERRRKLGMTPGDGALFAQWCDERKLVAAKDALASSAWSSDMVETAVYIINKEMPESA